ncbi:hypothetical protein PGT21_013618 [Puccinia graminis f. sp. tritici]|uniref:Uncharacterized protein n=1 Tax=Puccinia graminis f. sp. tritici TaxID=56615 RepID=A0A5B0PFL3_PUCGR|nr:hypothetical protein PGT21_013618 [Puccinia graminis f. sp. tritici]
MAGAELVEFFQLLDPAHPALSAQVSSQTQLTAQSALGPSSPFSTPLPIVWLGFVILHPPSVDRLLSIVAKFFPTSSPSSNGTSIRIGQDFTLRLPYFNWQQTVINGFDIDSLDAVVSQS